MKKYVQSFDEFVNESKTKDSKLIKGAKITIELDDEDGDFVAGDYKVTGLSRGNVILDGMGKRNLAITFGALNDAGYTINESRDSVNAKIRQELLKKPGGIGEDDVVFTIDDEKLDQLLNSRFHRQLDFQKVKGDEYYVLSRKEFDRFIDLGDSSGFDVDYENSEDAVIEVIE
jgi:hypothetical protein